MKPVKVKVEYPSGRYLTLPLSKLRGLRIQNETPYAIWCKLNFDDYTDDELYKIHQTIKKATLQYNLP